MRYEYRIKVEVKNNGEKRYIPQTATPKLTIGKRSVYPWLDWRNLTPTFTLTYSPTSFDPVSKEVNGCAMDSNTPYSSKSEQEAEDIINFHKEEIKRQEDNEIKTVYFINK